MAVDNIIFEKILCCSANYFEGHLSKKCVKTDKLVSEVKTLALRTSCVVCYLCYYEPPVRYVTCVAANQPWYYEPPVRYVTCVAAMQSALVL